MNNINIPSVLKISALGAALGAAFVLAGFCIGKNFDNAALNTTLNTDPTGSTQITVSKDKFKYLASGTPLSEGDQQAIDTLERKLSERFGRSVFLKKMKGTGLYLAIVQGKLFFVEETGRFFLKGEVLDLNSDVVVSSIIRTELDTIQSMSRALDQSKVAEASEFLFSDTGLLSATSENDDFGIQAKPKTAVPLHKEIKESKSKAIATNQIEKSTKLETPYTHSQPNTAQPIDTPVAIDNEGFYNISELPFGFGTDTPVDPAILTKARSLVPSMPTFADQCLSIGLEANSFVELYSIFNAMDKSTSTKCGGVLAGKYIPILKDENLVVYKAENEVGTVTLISDYTCQYCKRAHDEIPRYLEQGITVKVFPYGRKSYVRKDGRPTTLSDNLDILMCEDSNERKKELMDELMMNPRKYNKELLISQSNVTDQCRQQNYIYKVMGNVLTRGSTPMLVASTGIVGFGYIPHRSFIPQSKLK